MPVGALAIVETGLIGASVGLAAKRAGVARVAGFDSDAAALGLAAGRSAVDVAAIEDLELEHVSPDRGGVLALLVAGEGPASRAAELLEAQGYAVDVAPALDA